MALGALGPYVVSEIPSVQIFAVLNVGRGDIER